MDMILDLQFILRMLFSYIDFTSLTLISLSIYRIPILMYWKRLLVLQGMLLVLMVVHDQVLQNKDFYALSIAGGAIIFSTVLLRIPILYSLLVWGTGYLMYALIQTSLVLGLTGLGVISVQQMQSSVLLQNVFIIANLLIILALVFIIEKRRLGFMFVVNRFRLQKRNIQLKDGFIATFFICVVALCQTALISYISDQVNYSLLYVLGSMIVISLVGLYITYKFNIKEIDERFNVIRRK